MNSKFTILDNGLTINKISKTYGNKEVVRDISISINRGEIVGLLGPNGAGKTTTFYMLVGLIKSNSGEIYIDDKEITELPMHLRSDLGISYLPQEPSIFRNLNVKTKPSKMSFGFSLGNGELEYSGSNFNSFFAQRKNLFSIDHLKGLYDIFRFKGIALKFLSDCQEANESMRDFLLRNNFGKWFSEMFIVPMGAAIWSVPTGSILDFPARSYLRFFLNHGLLSMLTTEIDWKTVDGGSVKYVEKIIQKLGKNAFVNTPVKKLIRKKNKCEVTIGNGKRKMLFDKVVLSCDGPETLKIIGDASEKERSILGMFKTSKNKVVLHGDSSHMPTIKKVLQTKRIFASDTCFKCKLNKR